MAEWIRLRADLDKSLEMFRIARACGLSHAETILRLHRLAAWFVEHGKYGKLDIRPSLVDSFLDTPGFAAIMLECDWLRDHGEVLTLHGFCLPLVTRKALGRVLRSELLTGSSCAACASKERLVIDHIIPIARGGSCERSNLQVLCAPCNSAKGRKTMDEFRGAH